MERFREAHDLIIKSWTDPGPFSWEGKHFEVRYANVWPRPLQKPHPPIWIPGFGSSETIEWCAHPDRKYTYLAVYMPESLVKMYFDMYRECADKFGYTASSYQLGHVYPVYVGETDAKAEAEAKDHLLWLYHYGLRQKNEFLFPPGYVSHPSMMNILNHVDEMDWSNMSFGELNEKGFCIVGSAETVRQRLEHSAKSLGFGVMPVLLHFGDMPHDKTIRNMEMFANEVMPHLRGIHPKAEESEQPVIAAAD